MASWIIAGLLAAQAAAVGTQGDGCAAEGAAFMDAYANDLRAGDRAAIAARYSAQGAYLNGFEAKVFNSRTEIMAQYAGPGWQKPDAFEWRDLSYEAVGAEGCVVTGGFTWTSGEHTGELAYTALLRREQGEWRIRLEHENLLAPPPG